MPAHQQPRARALTGAARAGRRLAGAWRALAADQRLAAAAALGMFISMLLPWYTKSLEVVNGGRLIPHTESLNAFQSFSFVEAAVLLVAAGILAMLFARAEDRAFHLPGGDGTVVMIAGVWSALLVFYRLLDTPSTNLRGANIATNVGLKWGIFVALGSAIALAVAGSRVRAANHPEPALLEEQEPGGGPPGSAPAGAAAGPSGARPPAGGPPTTRTPAPGAGPAGSRRRPVRESPMEGQLSIEDTEPPTLEHGA